MRYGYFDIGKKEYVIDKPDTPCPWINYLGNPKFGSVISNNGLGYTFYKNGAEGRIIRYFPNALSTGQPGRFIYVYDKDKKDVFSNLWYPVMKNLHEYSSETCMGTGYMTSRGNYDKIEMNTVYYIPLSKEHEVWSFKIKNNDMVKRNFYVTGYCEFTNERKFNNDMVNLQYSHLISKTMFKDNAIIQSVNDNISEERFDRDNELKNKVKDAGEYRIFALAGADVSAYNGDREQFIGRYNTYANPKDIINGKLSCALNYNLNSCGALQTELSLEPGEEKHLVFLLTYSEQKDAIPLTAQYKDLSVIDSELHTLKNYWHNMLAKLQIKTPDESFNNAVNIWNQYQCYITFTWSRSASLQYNTGRDGYGYRDTVQDIQGITHFAHNEAGEKIRFMLSGQCSTGGASPVVAFDHKPGDIIPPDDPRYIPTDGKGHGGYRADDMLWMFPTIDKYIKETHDLEILDEMIGYADKGEGSVYEHLKKALLFNLERLGVHSLPMGLTADWNDCLRLGHDGESVFLAFQLHLAFKIFISYANLKRHTADAIWAEEELSKLCMNINRHAWDKDRFVRGFVGNDIVIGAKENDEANIWLNPRSWAVLSGWADKEQAKIAMDTAMNGLNTKYGLKIFAPSFTKFALPYARMTLINPGSKENGGIFSQIQGWAINAACKLGNGVLAYEIYEKCNPASMNDKAEIRTIEPYAHGQSIESYETQHEGRGHVSWLTGTASTVMVGIIEGILGLIPDFDGIFIDPCLPKWETIEIYKEWRGRALNITVLNPNKIEKGVKTILVNEKMITGNYIPFSALAKVNTIVVHMG